jgi:hypothetical protein
MGQKLLTVLVVSYLFFGGCKEKEEIIDDKPVYTQGTISSFKIDDLLLPKSNMNLSIFAAKENTKDCQYTDNFSLFIKHSSPTGSYVEKINISNLSPQRLGMRKVFTTYVTRCDTTIYSAISIGNPDFVWYIYEPLKKATNTITLSSYDSKTKEISGTFDITFVNIWGTPDSRLTYPDTIRLHDCQFKTVIND